MCLQLLSAHEGPISAVSFSPFQVLLASSSWDKTLRLWDVFEHKGVVEKLVHMSDGRWGWEGGRGEGGRVGPQLLGAVDKLVHMSAVR